MPAPALTLSIRSPSVLDALTCATTRMTTTYLGDNDYLASKPWTRENCWAAYPGLLLKLQQLSGRGGKVHFTPYETELLYWACDAELSQGRRTSYRLNELAAFRRIKDQIDAL